MGRRPYSSCFVMMEDQTGAKEKPFSNNQRPELLGDAEEASCPTGFKKGLIPL